MIRVLRASNFKPLQEVAVELGRLNVLVGANGVGKTSVLEALHYLLQLASARTWAKARARDGAGVPGMGPPGALFARRHRPERLMTRTGATYFALDASYDGGRFGVRWTPREHQDGPGTYEVWHEYDGVMTTIRYPRENGDNAPFWEELYRARLGEVVKLKLRADNLASDHYSDSEVPRIEFDGTGLASVLQYLQGLRDGTLEAIEADLAAIIPSTRRIRALPARLTQPDPVLVSVDGEESRFERAKEVTGARFEVEWGNLGWIPADQLSEGTLLALGIVTFFRHRPARLVLLDDIDSALHPIAQAQVVEMLRKTLERLPDLQIVATGHSPFLLDALRGEEVFVVGSAGDSVSQVQRLDEHPAWKKRSAYMHPGEFWSAVGEGWVAEPGS